MYRSFERAAVGQVALHDAPPDGLACGPVRLLQAAGGLGQGLLLALPLDGHAAHDLVVLVAQQRQLALQRHVLGAEDLGLVAEAAQQQRRVVARLVAGHGQQLLLQRLLGHPGLGLDHPHEVLEALLGRRVGRVFGDLPVDLRASLLQHGGQPAPLAQPAIGRGPVERGRQQRIHVRLRRAPVAGVDLAIETVEGHCVSMNDSRLAILT